MQCFQPAFSGFVNDSMSRKEAERKERKREVFFCEDNCLYLNESIFE